MSKSAAAGGHGARPQQGGGTESDRPAASQLMTPGRVVRVPVGYAWIAGGALLLVLVLAYVVGFSRGSTIAEESARRLAEGLAESIREGGRITDPLVERPTPLARVIDRVEVPDPPRRSTVLVPTKPVSPRPVAAREVGKAYFVAETPLAGRAEEIRAFIREEGLDALIVPTENTRFRQVIVLPGFAPGDAETRDRLRQRIIEIGRRFEQRGRNNDNFDDTYYAVHRK